MRPLTNWDIYQGIMDLLGAMYLIALVRNAPESTLTLLALSFFVWVVGVGVLLYIMEGNTAEVFDDDTTDER